MGAFILQLFYYSLGSGLIINLFVMLNVYVLDKKGYLPQYINFIKDIPAPYVLKVLIFILTVIMVGIFIEGINETCFQYYGKLHRAGKAFVPKRRKPEKDRRTFLCFLLWHIFRRVGIVEACLYLSKRDKKNTDKKNVVKEEKQKQEEEEKDEEEETEEEKKKRQLEKKKQLKMHKKNPLYNFMRDRDYTDPNEAMLTCEKVVISKNIKSEINMYKSFSFITQLARISFLLIAITCFILMIIITAVWGVNKIFWCVDNWEALRDLFNFYLAGFLVTLIIVILSTPMAENFGIRYVRDVGRWYNAIIISSKIPFPDQKGESMSKDTLETAVNLVTEIPLDTAGSE